MAWTLNEGQPFRAGNPMVDPSATVQDRRALNEGRPFRAGNPPSPTRVLNLDLHVRSTKAGPSGPATPGFVLFGE